MVTPENEQWKNERNARTIAQCEKVLFARNFIRSTSDCCARQSSQ